jgi:AcrR family transcriptional regulator
MQIKKEEVRLAILGKAEEEFLEHGFANASIRRIVKAAGTTIGNFYNYFANKEALFETLVQEEHASFVYLIQNHDKMARPDTLWEIKDPAEWREALTVLIQQVMPVFSERFILLVEGSRGTRFENARKLLTDMMREHFIEHIQSFSPGTIDVEFGQILAEQMLDGVVLILKRYKDGEIRKRLLTEYLLFYLLGTMNLLGDWR